MTEPQKPFADWIGRTSESEDVVTDRLAASFRALFEPHLAPTEGAPLGIHWCLSPAVAPMEALGPDGHPAKNRDLPPVPLPRRMWAGGSVETLQPLRVGDTVRRVTTIADVAQKHGRSGELWFVVVNHAYETARGVAIRERHDIVYREAVAAQSRTPEAATGARAGEPAWTVPTTSTLLFRYSALTFNGHRIHYDLPYATGVEGYAGLVVHGPLQATLLFNLAAARLGALPRRFDYRGVAAAIAGAALDVSATSDGDQLRLWTSGPDGQVHMEATALHS